MEQDGTDRGGGERDGGQIRAGGGPGEADALFTEVMNLLRSYLELLSNQSGDQNQERMLITEGKWFLNTLIDSNTKNIHTIQCIPELYYLRFK